MNIPEELAKAVEAYVQAQEAWPALTTVVQAALCQYLAERGYLGAAGPLRITPARRGSGRRGVSQAHDHYLAGLRGGTHATLDATSYRGDGIPADREATSQAPRGFQRARRCGLL